MMRTPFVVLTAALALAALPTVAAVAGPGQDLLDAAEQVVVGVGPATTGVLQDPAATLADPSTVTDPLLNPQQPEPDPPGTPPGDENGGFADGVRDALAQHWMTAGAAGFVLAGLGLTGFALVSRFMSPKEALENPQRSMLYGYVRGHPGVNLKRLSEEFGLKTSSILWHMRKLESAQLCRTERANGFRVFYPTEGGIEIKKVSRALSALQTANALSLYTAIEAHPGVHANELAGRLQIHPGTARWHLRKLLDYGLIAETGDVLYPTDTGRRARQLVASQNAAPSGPVDRSMTAAAAT